MASGAFHGVISRQGPTGCLVTSTRAVPSSLTFQLPSIRTGSAPNRRR